MLLFATWTAYGLWLTILFFPILALCRVIQPTIHQPLFVSKVVAFACSWQRHLAIFEIKGASYLENIKSTSH